ncbi:hypothetical protein AVEN_119816-1 [Araneus ventricosus]|uniref:Integrase catalytic domain-containing protein n=1 Tax=Araneus ventricosus TaxID=182803 RepID=A0A4Y2MUU2_ARAVE|nr:hypothetical protein AVEN_119816-1 [Araneus ventricosus]
MKKLLADYLDLPDSTNLEEYLDVIYTMEEEIEDLQVKFRILITKYCKASNADNVPMTVHKPKLKTPDLPLPEFTGKYEEYKSFKTRFMSIIGNNESLNDNQKCCYLKASLKGDAKFIESNQDTFQSLLSALDARYQNKRAVIDTLIENVLSVGKANDSPRQLRNLVDIIKRNLRALENLKLSRNNLSDALLVHILEGKIDSESQRLFQMENKSSEILSLDCFLNFIEDRARILGSVSKNCTTTVNSNSNKQFVKPKQNFSRPKSPIVNSHNKSKKCVLQNCDESHPLHRCSKFKSFKLSDRIDCVQMRAILDSASEINIISSDCANFLGLKKEKLFLPVSGICGSTQNASRKVTTSLSNLNGNYQWDIELMVLPKITDFSPATRLDVSDLKIPENIQLADETFYIPQKVDLLLGCEPFFEFIKADKIRLNDSRLILQDTCFGYIVAGSIEPIFQINNATSHCFLSRGMDTLDKTLRSFWEIENVTCDSSPISEELNYCNEHYEKTHYRNSEGRYVVQMPFKPEIEKISLGDSYQMASKSLNLWKRLNRDPTMKFLYSEFLREYKNLNHMEEITNCNHSNDDGYFLPHQGVLRPSSITTKLRVVFDVSAKTTTGYSLNDLLCAGGVLQDDLFSILTRFRKHQYAFTVVHISKMFRQIEINPSQRKYLKILWKEGPEENVKVFASKTVTYGTTSAPFLATRTLQQLAKDERENFPIASKVLLEDFYMDDCLSGASDINQFIALKKELGELLLRGGMTLHKCKSRVAPIKSETIPRLELAACPLLAQLTRKMLNALKLKIDQVLPWSDSTVDLSWIDTSPHLLKAFLSNRVAQIQELTKEYHWSHITSKNNPADLLSRGIDAQFLVNNQFWFQGPDSFNSLNSETELNQSDKNYLSEFKSKDSVCLTVKTSALFEDVISISNNFQKLIRIISLIFRFINKCKKNSKECGAPSKIERQSAEIYILREVQVRTFGNEIHSIKQCGNVTPNSKLKSLSPFLDSQGILRVGGRLRNSILPYNSKHPILLPAKHKVTDMIIQYCHKIQFHSGPQALLYNIRQKFWPLNGRNLSRKIVHSCVTCFKANPKISSQKMGDLPEDRVNPNFVFNSVGIDFAGPFYIKTKLRKRDPPTKIYVCIIICLSTKAIHLELVSDLSSEALIAALKRFMARRGKCRKILSDNATNFVGTKNEINRLFKLMEQQDALFQNFLSEEEITWSHIPPRAPHYGGLWEVGVKSFKFYFKRVVSNTCLTYEEFLTILIQIEELLNSRPLTPLSSEVEDLEILTPGHFLIGRPITAIPKPLMIELNDNRLNRWQLLTKKVQAIWKHWSKNYLNNLQQRHKWMFKKDNVKIGDMVLIKEDNVPVSNWPLGRVVKLYPGKDNIIRVVDIKTKTGIFKRSVSRLCVLPIER